MIIRYISLIFVYSSIFLEYVQNNFVTGVGICRTEVLSVKLEIPPGQDSGISVCEDRDLLLISHITHQSPAYRYTKLKFILN